MRTILTAVLLAFSTILMTLSAQAPPEAFNYSGAARNGIGLPVYKKTIGVEFSILKGSANGSIEYRETHYTKTNAFGVFNAAIGNGTVQEGDFSSIDWGSDIYFIKVSLDINGGSNFTEVGVSQLLSVPYALYAKSAGNASAQNTEIVAGNHITITGDGSSNDPYVISATAGYTGPAIYTVGGGVTDVDGNTYPTIVIGDQEWMAENLKVAHYRNGAAIPNVIQNANWKNQLLGAWCNYSNNPDRDDEYGKLYNFMAVTDSRQLCPTGWHVPSNDEWTTLMRSIDPFSNPFQGNSGFTGGMMKSKGTLQTGDGLWMFPNTEASNGSGFSAVPNAKRSQAGDFTQLGFDAYWWSSSENNILNANGRAVFYGLGICVPVSLNKRSGLAVRCVKD